MKETGIIMSGDHPLKCLDGTKTMTRRTWGLAKINEDPDAWVLSAVFEDGYARFFTPDGEGDITVKCPYGGVGDILVMKETWATENRYNHLKPSEIPDTAKIFYLASEPRYDPFKMGIIRSSLFMPYKFSRGRFEITEVRAERLQEITLADIKAEGIKVPTGDEEGEFQDWAVERIGRVLFKRLWDSLNAKRGYGWDLNKWVWPISFKRLGRGL